MTKFVIADPSILKIQNEDLPFSEDLGKIISSTREEVGKEDYTDKDYDDFNYFFMVEKMVDLREAIKLRSNLGKSHRSKEMEIARAALSIKKAMNVIIEEALFNKSEKHIITLDLTETEGINVGNVIKLFATFLDFVNRDITIYLIVTESKYMKLQEDEKAIKSFLECMQSEGVTIERVQFANMIEV